MTGEERRRAISGLIGSSPRTASGLAELFGVSRQVIVQDVALLRAEGAKIISTNRGYVAENPSRASRVFKVRHTDAQVREELYLIVDAGGRVEDVYVKISAPMGIDSRRKAEEFVKKIESGVSAPLKNITGGYHYHTVSAESEAVLDGIAAELRAHGFFVAEEN